MNSSLLHEPRWHHASQVRRQLPAPLRSWLVDETSLTRRLQLACRERFRVELLSSHWAVPCLSESKALGIRSRERALIRQVRLWCDEQVWVFARTIIPVSSLRGAQRRLVHLGNRPLGAYLFANPALRRSPLEVAQVSHRSRLLADCDGLQQPLWGRRSLFTLQNHSLLVSEFFLPALPPFAARVVHE